MLSQIVHSKNLSQSKESYLRECISTPNLSQGNAMLDFHAKPNRPIKHYIAYDLIKSSISGHHLPIKLA